VSVTVAGRTVRSRPTDVMALRLWLLSRVAVFALVSAAGWLFADRAARSPTHYLDRWTQWDTVHYLTIAHWGYGGGPGGPQVPLEAFFPGFPLTMRAVHVVLGIGYLTAGLVISFVAGGVAIVALARLAADEAGGGDLGEVLAERTVLLFLLAPSAIFLAAAYTEALFLVFALWA